MKKLLMITTVILMAGFFNSTLIAAKNTDTTMPAPIPEVIECESKGNCEMTPLDTLQSATDN